MEGKGFFVFRDNSKITFSRRVFIQTEGADEG